MHGHQDDKIYVSVEKNSDSLIKDKITKLKGASKIVKAVLFEQHYRQLKLVDQKICA